MINVVRSQTWAGQYGDFESLIDSERDGPFHEDSHGPRLPLGVHSNQTVWGREG